MHLTLSLPHLSSICNWLSNVEANPEFKKKLLKQLQNLKRVNTVSLQTTWHCVNKPYTAKVMFVDLPTTTEVTKML